MQHHRKRFRTSSAFLAAFVAAVLSGCGGASDTASDTATDTPDVDPTQSATQFSPALQTLIDGAEQEGQLSLNWGSGNLPQTIPTLFEDFNEYYGLDLKLNYSPQSNIPQVMSQLRQEHKANQPASTDAFFAGSAPHIITMKEAGVLDPDPKWGEWGDSIPEEALDGAPGEPKIAVAVQTLIGGLVYNTDMVTDVPETPADILALDVPLAATPYAAMFPQMGSEELLGVEKTTQFLEEFAPKVTGLIGCGDLDRIASGEFGGLFIACSQASYLALKEKGAPIEFAPIKDMAMAQHSYVAFPTNAAHPNAARLWANYLMTPEAQATLYEKNYADSMVTEGGQTEELVAEYASEGFDYVIVDIPTQLAIPEEFEDKAKSYFSR